MFHPRGMQAGIGRVRPPVASGWGVAPAAQSHHHRRVLHPLDWPSGRSKWLQSLGYTQLFQVSQPHKNLLLWVNNFLL